MKNRHYETPAARRARNNRLWFNGPYWSLIKRIGQRATFSSKVANRLRGS